MKKKVSIMLAVCLTVLLMVIPAFGAEAASITPTASDNLSVGLRSKSELVATSDGYMRVFYDGKKINIEYYDNSFNIKSKKSVAMELDLWGGFYAGSNAYYVVEGKNNTAESDTAEVIRVIKYDTNWNKKGTAKITGNPSLFGGEVRYPFDYGCVEMTEYNGTLYIVTGHEGYVDPPLKQGHQGFLMIAVNTSTMKGEIVDSDLWHSFAQYITSKGSYLYVLEQSEGSRYTKLSKYNAGDINQNESIPVLRYGGTQTSARAIACYASVDGIAVSSGNVLCLGTSIDQLKYDTITSDDEHNIYLTVTPISNFTEDATTVKWLTNYSGGGKCFLGTKITKVNDNRFMVSWEEFETEKTASASDSLSGSVLHYIFIDGKGNKLTKEFTAAAPISDCQPIVKGSKIVYYASNGNMVNFYTINAETGSFSKKAYRVAGENATWEIKNDVLTISGPGAIDINGDVNYRSPVSSTRGWYSYSSGDNCWKGVRDYVKKLVISKGLTSIPEKAFVSFSNLTEVDIKSGLKSIGKEAFYGNLELAKITIPASVTSIGEDALWTGRYWVSDHSHAVFATIYCYSGSYAEKYAKQEDIWYVTLISAPKISKVENVNGGVKITWGKVSGAENYRVFYKANDESSWHKAGDTTSTSLTWNKAKNNTKYTFAVRCTDYSGTEYVSDLSASTSIKYIAAPQLSSVENTATGVKITWGKVAGAENYRVFYKDSSGKWTKITDTTSTSYTWKDAKSGTKYSFTVRCVDKEGSSYTSSYDSKGKTLTYIAAPKLSSVANAATGAKITWGKVTGAAKYRVFYKDSSGKWTKIADTTSTSYTWTKAKSGTKYTFTVRCLDKNNKYIGSYDSKGKTLTYIAAPKLSSAANTATGVKISWGKVTGAAKYRVFYKTGNSGWKKIADTTSTSYTWKGVKSGTKYTFTVRCLDKNNNYIGSYDSKGKSVTYIAAPKISSLAKTSSGVQIKWGKVAGAVNYKVFRKNANGGWTVIGTTTSTSFVDKTAKKGTKYTYTVSCVSKDGKSYTSAYDSTGKSVKA